MPNSNIANGGGGGGSAVYAVNLVSGGSGYAGAPTTIFTSAGGGGGGGGWTILQPRPKVEQDKTNPLLFFINQTQIELVEIINWLSKNGITLDRWAMNHAWHIVELGFTNEKDAMFFKLTWYEE